MLQTPQRETPRTFPSTSVTSPQQTLKGSPDAVEFKSGPGTRLTVSGEYSVGLLRPLVSKPTPPVVSGPTARVPPEQTANKFYPWHLKLTWLENGDVSQTEMASPLIENKDGTFNWTSWLLVISSAHREDVVLNCQVEHDGQPAITKHHTLEASSHQKEQDTAITAHCKNAKNPNIASEDKTFRL
ncbi:hypothetical protein HPG69_008519 [Diceros bicornis minor]|uniref:Immunoglobulin C1-set domain-containing protein n=1 Tax=Diceros bicornis minor TaxID=77932 RepID=A0A7J7FA75_DICBM|nr:hypothetical protein HPG69_008519 [Diceros bicornis minor]